MTGVFTLTYVSSASVEFSAEDLEELLKRSRSNNLRLGVTGLLLYKDGNFMQAIEGREDVVTGLFENIASDDRHSGVITLHRDHIPQRQFSDWTMGFRNLDVGLPKNLPGYDEFLDTPLTGCEFAPDPTRSQRLLLSFKRGM